MIKKILIGNGNQTADMRKLRNRIKSSFEKVTAFLMPYPGAIVAQTNEFTGNLNQIDPQFLKYVKELVPAILAPENLIFKKINGQKVRVRDFFLYLEAYLTVFNGDTLPEPKSIFMVSLMNFITFFTFLMSMNLIQ